MKKASISLTVIFLAAMSCFTVFAATTAHLDLAGYIGEPPGELSLELTRTPEQQEPIDLAQGVSMKSVGTLEANSNGPIYVINITSSNGFELTHSSSASVPYTLTITGESSWENNEGWPNPGQTVNFEWHGVGNSFYDLAVTALADDPSALPSGTYTDTLTFAILAK